MAKRTRKVKGSRGKPVDKRRSQAAKKGWATRRKRQREDNRNEVLRLRLELAEYEGRFFDEARDIADNFDVAMHEIITFYKSPDASDFSA